MQHDNPAERLLCILKQGKEFKPDTSCRKAWQQLLSVEDESLLLIRIGKVVALPLEIILILRRDYPTTENTWSHWYNQVVHAFGNQSLGGQWATFINQIDTHTITGLQLSAALLQAKSSISIIEKDRLDDLKRRLTEIFDEVKNSDEIGSLLKKNICKLIQKIIASIDEYSITGIDGISDSLDAIVGHVIINPNARHFVKKNSIGKKLINIIKSVHDTVSTVQDIKEIGEDASSLLDLF